MTKYQIVYTKLETTLYNIIRTTEARKKWRYKRAFQKLAHNANQLRVKRENRQKLVCVHLENKLTSFANAMTRYIIHKEMQQCFSKWKQIAQTTAAGEELQKTNEEKVVQIDKEIGINKAILVQYDEKLNASSQENQATTQQIEDSQ